MRLVYLLLFIVLFSICNSCHIQKRSNYSAYVSGEMKNDTIDSFVDFVLEAEDEILTKILDSLNYNDINLDTIQFLSTDFDTLENIQDTVALIELVEEQTDMLIDEVVFTIDSTIYTDSISSPFHQVSDSSLITSTEILDTIVLDQGLTILSDTAVVDVNLQSYTLIVQKASFENLETDSIPNVADTLNRINIIEKSAESLANKDTIVMSKPTIVKSNKEHVNIVDTNFVHQSKTIVQTALITVDTLVHDTLNSVKFNSSKESKIVLKNTETIPVFDPDSSKLGTKVENLPIVGKKIENVSTIDTSQYLSKVLFDSNMIKNQLIIDSLENRIVAMQNNVKSLTEISNIVKPAQTTINNSKEIRLTLFYKTNSSTPTNSIESINSVIKMYQESDSAVVHLSSYTDSGGSDKTNSTLSLKRVQYLKTMLVKKGVNEKDIFIQYFGEKYANPISNDLDRKVDLTIQAISIK